MKRLRLLLCALILCTGCATEAQKGQWEEVWKDLRGDNMRMRSDFGSPEDSHSIAH